MKKFLSIVLSFAMVVSLTAMPVGAAPTTNSSSGSQWSDVPTGFWAKSYLEKAMELGLISGYQDGSVRPNASLTRGQFVTIVMRALGLDNVTGSSLADCKDVNQKTWCYQALSAANALGVIQGNNGKMSPDAPLTRQQGAAMLQRALELSTDNNRNITTSDAASISGYAYSAMQTMFANGVLQGKNGKADPQGPLTRAQFAAMMLRIATDYVHGSANDRTWNGNVVVTGNDSKLSNCTINGNLLFAKNLSSNKITLSNVTVSGDLRLPDTCTSLAIEGSSRISGTVYVNSEKQALAIKASLASNIESVKVANSGTKLILEGKFGTVTVADEGCTVDMTKGSAKQINLNAPSIKFNLGADASVNRLVSDASRQNLQLKGEVTDLNLTENGTNGTINISEDVDTITVSGDKAKITVNSGAKVKEVNASGEDMDLTGSGTVDKVNLNKGAKDADISTRNTTVNNKSGSSVTVGGKSLSSGSTSSTNSNGTSSTTSGSTTSGGSSTSGGSTGGSTNTTVTKSSATFAVVKDSDAQPTGLSFKPSDYVYQCGVSGTMITGTIKDNRTNVLNKSSFNSSVAHYYLPLLVKVVNARSTTTIDVQDTMTNSKQRFTYSSSYITSGDYKGYMLVWAELDSTTEGQNDAGFQITVDTDGTASGYSASTYTIKTSKVKFDKTSKPVEPPDTRLVSSAYVRYMTDGIYQEVVQYAMSDWETPSDADRPWDFDALAVNPQSADSTTFVVGSVPGTGKVYKPSAVLSHSTREGDSSGSTVERNTGYAFPVVLEVTGATNLTTITVGDRTYTYWDGCIHRESDAETEGLWIVWLNPTADNKKITVTVDADGGANNYKPTEYVFDMSSVELCDTLPEATVEPPEPEKNVTPVSVIAIDNTKAQVIHDHAMAFSGENAKYTSWDWKFENLSSDVSTDGSTITVSVVSPIESYDVYKIPAVLSHSTRQGDASGATVAENGTWVVPVILDLSGTARTTTTAHVENSDGYSRDYNYWDGCISNDDTLSTAMDNAFIVWVPISKTTDSATITVDADGVLTNYDATTLTVKWSDKLTLKDELPTILEPEETKAVFSTATNVYNMMDKQFPINIQPDQTIVKLDQLYYPMDYQRVTVDNENKSVSFIGNPSAINVGTANTNTAAYVLMNVDTATEGITVTSVETKTGETLRQSGNTVEVPFVYNAESHTFAPTELTIHCSNGKAIQSTLSLPGTYETVNDKWCVSIYPYAESESAEESDLDLIEADTATAFYLRHARSSGTPESSSVTFQFEVSNITVPQDKLGATIALDDLTLNAAKAVLKLLAKDKGLVTVTLDSSKIESKDGKEFRFPIVLENKDSATNGVVMGHPYLWVVIDPKNMDVDESKTVPTEYKAPTVSNFSIDGVSDLTLTQVNGGMLYALNATIPTLDLNKTNDFGYGYYIPLKVSGVTSIGSTSFICGNTTLMHKGSTAAGGYCTVDIPMDMTRDGYTMIVLRDVAVEGDASGNLYNWYLRIGPASAEVYDQMKTNAQNTAADAATETVDLSGTVISLPDSFSNGTVELTNLVNGKSDITSGSTLIHTGASGRYTQNVYSVKLTHKTGEKNEKEEEVSKYSFAITLTLPDAVDSTSYNFAVNGATSSWEIVSGDDNIKRDGNKVTFVVANTVAFDNTTLIRDIPINITITPRTTARKDMTQCIALTLAGASLAS